jgi:hypothetical protein
MSVKTEREGSVDSLNIRQVWPILAVNTNKEVECANIQKPGR